MVSEFYKSHKNGNGINQMHFEKEKFLSMSIESEKCDIEKEEVQDQVE
jgi:hypothetical protein